eukprot:799594-Rhodomonas_salina.5
MRESASWYPTIHSAPYPSSLSTARRESVPWHPTIHAAPDASSVPRIATLPTLSQYRTSRSSHSAPCVISVPGIAWRSCRQIATWDQLCHHSR